MGKNALKNWFSRNGRAMIAGLYIFVALSGASIYFHFYPFSIWWSHAQIGMALVVASAALVRRHWAAVKVELPRAALFVFLAFVVGGGVKTVMPAPTPKAAPKDSTHQILYALTHMPLEQLAPVFGNDPERIAGRLRDLGFVVASNRQSLYEIARASGRSEREALAALTELLWKKESDAQK